MLPKSMPNSLLCSVRRMVQRPSRNSRFISELTRQVCALARLRRGMPSMFYRIQFHAHAMKLDFDALISQCHSFTEAPLNCHAPTSHIIQRKLK